MRATLNESARRNEPVFLFLDEVQNLAAWDVQLKTLVDHSTVRVMVTGSSALRIEMGRDSLAGRIHSLEVGPLRLTEIAALRGFGELKPLQLENGWREWLTLDFWRELQALGQSQAEVIDQAFAAFSQRGAYPLAQTLANVSWEDIAAQLNETVVKRVIEHAIRAAWLQEVIPPDEAALDRSPHLQDLAGRIAESTVGYFFASLTGLSVAHLPERSGDPEVDFVLTL